MIADASLIQSNEQDVRGIPVEAQSSSAKRAWRKAWYIAFRVSDSSAVVMGVAPPGNVEGASGATGLTVCEPGILNRDGNIPMALPDGVCDEAATRLFGGFVGAANDEFPFCRIKAYTVSAGPEDHEEVSLRELILPLLGPLLLVAVVDTCKPP